MYRDQTARREQQTGSVYGRPTEAEFYGAGYFVLWLVVCCDIKLEIPLLAVVDTTAGCGGYCHWLRWIPPL